VRTAVAVENVASVLESNGLTTADKKVGDIVISDDGIGSNAITLSGADAALLKWSAASCF
jgi:dihydroxyacetone kinase